MNCPRKVHIRPILVMLFFTACFLFFLLIEFSMPVAVQVPAQEDLRISRPNTKYTATTANIVTEEWVQSIINSNSKYDDLELIDFSVSPGSEIGDHFSSDMYSVKINSKSKTTGEFSTTNVMLKMKQQDPSLKQSSINLRKFEKEAKMYSQVLPDFVKFQQGRGLKEQEIFKAFPKFYKFQINNSDTDNIAIEDLRPLGFKWANRANGLDFIHCEIALRNLARFHAVSFAMFGGDYNKVQEQYPLFEETRLLYPNENAKLTEGWISNAVVVHGDFWSSNVMFVYDQESGKPKEARLVDFQASRISSRAVDLNYFMYISAQITVLNEQEVQLLRIYHEEFTSFLTKLGYINKGLTFQALLDEFQSFRPYGISAKAHILTAHQHLKT